MVVSGRRANALLFKHNIDPSNFAGYSPSMVKGIKKSKRISRRYGAAELFGRAIISMSDEELRHLSSANHKKILCPFKMGKATCHKKGGVCSLGLYERKDDQSVSVIGQPVTTCPSRFLEDGRIYNWVGEVLLGETDIKIVKEVSFLMSNRGDNIENNEVGRIDNVLLREEGGLLKWCALEMQAVYFSGGNMGSDFKLMRTWGEKNLPFPSKQRRPDFRSSGPKRLMPQLQIKIPTLRRWGKKMAVVVDKSFWESLGQMQHTSHISNADIVWFIVSYSGPTEGRYRMHSNQTYCTTLEDAITGLTGGTPVSFEQFEDSLRQKLGRGEAK